MTDCFLQISKTQHLAGEDLRRFKTAATIRTLEEVFMNTLSCLGASPPGDDTFNLCPPQADYPNMAPQTQESANTMVYSVGHFRFLPVSFDERDEENGKPTDGSMRDADAGW